MSTEPLTSSETLTCLSSGGPTRLLAFSDSWGTDVLTYTLQSKQVDEWAWENQDFLPLLAAGNYGSRSVSRNIAAPANAKNCLTVGATLGPYSLPPPVASAVTVVLKAEDVGVDARVLTATFGPSFTGSAGAAVQGGLLLRAAQPPQACSELTNADALAGHIALVQRGGCFFSVKVRGFRQCALIHSDLR